MKYPAERMARQNNLQFFNDKSVDEEKTSICCPSPTVWTELCASVIQYDSLQTLDQIPSGHMIHTKIHIPSGHRIHTFTDKSQPSPGHFLSLRCDRHGNEAARGPQQALSCSAF